MGCKFHSALLPDSNNVLVQALGTQNMTLFGDEVFTEVGDPSLA